MKRFSSRSFENPYYAVGPRGREPFAVAGISHGRGASVVTEQLAYLLAFLHVPQVHRTCAIGRDEGVAVRSERQSLDPFLVCLQSAEFLAGLHFPKDDPLVDAARGQDFAIGVQGQATHFTAMASKLRQFLASGCIPDANRPIRAGGRDEFAIRGERDAGNPAAMPQPDRAEARPRSKRQRIAMRVHPRPACWLGETQYAE